MPKDTEDACVSFPFRMCLVSGLGGPASRLRGLGHYGTTVHPPTTGLVGHVVWGVNKTRPRLGAEPAVCTLCLEQEEFSAFERHDQRSFPLA